MIYLLLILTTPGFVLVAKNKVLVYNIVSYIGGFTVISCLEWLIYFKIDIFLFLSRINHIDFVSLLRFEGGDYYGIR